MKKLYYSYNPDWVLPTRGDNFSTMCVLCLAKNSLKYEGKSALEIHATKKHQSAVSNKQKQTAIATFMTKKGSQEEDKIAAAELTSVYHAMKHSQNSEPALMYENCFNLFIMV